MSFSIRSEKGSAGARRFIIEMTAGKFALVCFLLLFGFSWMFTFGVMLGRGFNPEESVPALARVMPSPDTADVLPATLDNEDDADKDAADNGIIKTEELNLLRSLRSRDEHQPAQRRTPPRPAAPEQASAAPAAPRKVPATAVRSVPPDSIRYRYLDQVASLQDAAAAHRFAEHLQESGISAGVERVNTSKGVWHRINVTLSGTTEEAQALRRRLATLGIRQPLLKEQETISD